jgi:hypothetical protein
MAEEDNNEHTREVRTLTTLLEKNGNDALKLAESLLADNADWRKKNRDLKAKIPAEGSRVLSADDAKKYDELQQIFSNLDLEQVKQRVEKYPDLEKSNKELSQMETLRELAEVGGYKIPALKKIMQDFPDAEISFKEESDQNNKVRKVPYIRTDGKESSFDAFVDQHKLADVYSLKANETHVPVGNPPNPPASGDSTSLFDRIRKDAEAKKKAAPPAPSLRDIAVSI